jgi:hypothetical protein
LGHLLAILRTSAVFFGTPALVNLCSSDPLATKPRLCLVLPYMMPKKHPLVQNERKHRLLMHRWVANDWSKARCKSTPRISFLRRAFNDSFSSAHRAGRTASLGRAAPLLACYPPPGAWGRTPARRGSRHRCRHLAGDASVTASSRAGQNLPVQVIFYVRGVANAVSAPL